MSLFIITAIAALASSLIAKWLVDAFLDERIPVLGTFAGLELAHNSGVAFGLRLPSGWQEAVIIGALFFVCVLAYKTKKTLASSLGYGLIVGGALGNVLDRLRDGVVTDFFQVGSFPIFNIADSCITIGVLFLLAETLGIVRSN
ncbi:signal peptidase II [Candidatus Peribacteria bacterium]|nr:MAG: signal peptidase II [Candidatus Peribacteria bacterium]